MTARSLAGAITRFFSPADQFHYDGSCESSEGASASPRIIVAFRNSAESLGSLRWAIHEAKLTNSQLVVLHQAPVGVAVQNGPSAAIAHQLGNPTWATVFAVASGLGAPAGTITVVESAAEAALIARFWTPGSRVVVGAGSHAKRLDRRLAFAADIVQVSSDWIKPSIHGAGLIGSVANKELLVDH